MTKCVDYLVLRYQILETWVLRSRIFSQTCPFWYEFFRERKERHSRRIYIAYMWISLYSRNNRSLLCRSFPTSAICITWTSGCFPILAWLPSVSKINRRVRSLDQTANKPLRICQNNSWQERSKWKDNIFLPSARENFTPHSRGLTSTSSVAKILSYD